MKFLRLYFQDLRNEEWFQFFTEFKNLTIRFTPEALDITALFSVFLVLYADADIVLEVIRKSLETALMDDADQKRDRTFRGFADAVKSACNHFEPVKQQAANELVIVFKHFGNLVEKAPNEETASICNFLEEMNGAYAPQIELLGLGEWIVELDNRNQAYEELVNKRNTKVTSRTTLRMADVRKQVQGVYRQIIERVESLAVVNGDEPYAPFITELNGYIKRYSDVMAQRKGQRKNHDNLI
jgi:hypothetical protein